MLNKLALGHVIDVPPPTSPDRVAVLMGGSSSERDVSLAGGELIFEALQRLGHEAVQVDQVSVEDIISCLLVLQPVVAFNALLGNVYEDGTLQAALEAATIRYTHSGPTASRLGIDKVRSLAIAKNGGIETATSVWLSEPVTIPPLPYPLIVKPRFEGSSNGLERINNDAEWIRLERCNVLVETYIPGIELSCGVINGEATDVVEIAFKTTNGLFDSGTKYSYNKATHFIPARIPAFVAETVRTNAQRMHTMLGCCGATRSDFRYDPATGRVVLLEINIQPAMTANSLLPDLLRARGQSYDDLVALLLADACLGKV